MNRLAVGRGRAVWLALGASACAVFGGLVLLLGRADPKWFVFVAAGMVMAGLAAVFDLRKVLIAAFVLGLSVDAHYYITKPLPMLYTGMTTPGALSIPLALLPGLFLLGRQALVRRFGGPPVDWAWPVSGPMIWMLGAALVSVALSPFQFAGLCVVWQAAALCALFIITLSLVGSRPDAARIAKLLLAAMVGQCSVFFLQAATGVRFNAVGKVVAMAGEGGSLLHQVTGTAASSTAGFAMFMDPLVMLGYVFYRTEPASQRKNAYAAMFMVGVAVLALTLNRSTWLALPLGLGIAEWLLRRRGLVGRRSGRSRGFGLAPVAAVAILVLAFPLFQSVRKAKHEVDLEQRFDLMGPAWEMIKANPVFGVGPGAYGWMLKEYAGGHRGWLYVAHNDYLLIWAERGMFGILTWLLFLRALGREMVGTSRRLDPWDATFGVGATAGFAMQLWEVFWTAAMAFPSYGVMYVIAGVCAGLNRHVPEVKGERENLTSTRRMVGTCDRAQVPNVLASDTR